MVFHEAFLWHNLVFKVVFTASEILNCVFKTCDLQDELWHNGNLYCFCDLEVMGSNPENDISACREGCINLLLLFARALRVGLPFIRG
ncbi:hypothetical protein RIF29_24282 [Crotalaria pallida]|uniref:Uncharacterized protein n=1 Tax=Crotalaria pallida TaxID=3830 RepID=A0AAN9I009_CROPI